MMRCLTIDSDPLMLAQITGYIAKTPFLELVAACTNAFDALKILNEQKVDLLFVEVGLPEINGIELVRSLSAPPLVVFMASGRDQAYDSYAVNAVDYVLKPVDYSGFLRSAERANRRDVLQKKEAPMPFPGCEPLYVKSEYKMIRIDMNKITHIKSVGEYVRVYMDSGHPLMTLGSLKAFEGKLPSDRFMRVHRSYIVNLQKIVAVERNHILIDEETRLPIGEQYKDVFKEYLGRLSLN